MEDCGVIVVVNDEPVDGHGQTSADEAVLPHLHGREEWFFVDFSIPGRWPPERTIVGGVRHVMLVGLRRNCRSARADVSDRHLRRLQRSTVSP
jgi:hypothetical protein